MALNRPLVYAILGILGINAVAFAQTRQAQTRPAQTRVTNPSPRTKPGATYTSPRPFKTQTTSPTRRADAPIFPPSSSVSMKTSAPRPTLRTHYAFEFHLSSLTKTGSITIDPTSAGIYLRSIGLDGCLRGAGVVFNGSRASDLLRFCMGYHTAQIDSARNGTFPVDYRETDVMVIPITLEPGIRIPTSPTTAFVINGVLRKMLVMTAESDIYTLGRLTDLHYGAAIGMEARLAGLDALSIGIATFFKEGLSLSVGFVKQFN